MNTTQLKMLVKHGESELLELKKSTGSITSGMQTACALLNSDQGGIVIFGIDDDGKILGQNITDKTRKDLALELNKIEPFPKIDVQYIQLANKLQVIALIVPAGNNGPYMYDGRPYIRKQSTTMRMTGEEFSYIYNKHNPTVWESLPNHNCTIEDLDDNRIRQIVRLAVDEKRLPEEALKLSIQDVLRKLGLLIDEKLTNAAVILFCKNEYKQCFQSHIRLARFKGTTKTEFLDNKQYHGNAFDLYEKADAFLTFCIPVAAKIVSGLQNRVETPAIPYSVTREALTNALIHRDYSHPGGCIAIAVYDDRVNIDNIGALPLGLQLSELTKIHKSVQRNPLIANVFYLCGKIEKWEILCPSMKKLGVAFQLLCPLKNEFEA